MVRRLLLRRLGDSTALNVSQAAQLLCKTLSGRLEHARAYWGRSHCRSVIRTVLIRILVISLLRGLYVFVEANSTGRVDRRTVWLPDAAACSRLIAACRLGARMRYLLGDSHLQLCSRPSACICV